MKSTALYIASRYLIAKKGSQAVSFITGLAAFAMTVAVAAMFIILSVFSGLEDINKEIISNLHSDLTIRSNSGKTIKNLNSILSVLSKEKEIEVYSRVIEEKIYINYRNNGEIAYLRGVDSSYTKINPIDKTIFYGGYPSFKYDDEVIMENGLNNRLAIAIGTDIEPSSIYMPKPGTGIVNKEEDIFRKENIYTVGIFSGNDQLNNYIIAPISLCERLLNLPKNSAYRISIKLKNPTNADFVKEKLKQDLNSNDLKIFTKEEQNAAFWKMINTEKLMIYLIFGLVIFITTFNLAGAIIIIQLDKKEQAKSLISLGFTITNLRKLYFYTGVLIVLFGICSGLIIGSGLSFIQMKYEWFMANENLPFPVRIKFSNYLIVASTALFFGLIISWVFSKVKKENIFHN